MKLDNVESICSAAVFEKADDGYLKTLTIFL